MAHVQNLESLKVNTTVTAGDSAVVVQKDVERSDLTMQVDPSAAAAVYILLGSGTASSSNFTFALTPGGFWDGRLTTALWQGPVSIAGDGATKVGITAG